MYSQVFCQKNITQRGQATTKNVKSMPLKNKITKFHKNKYVK